MKRYVASAVKDAAFRTKDGFYPRRASLLLHRASSQKQRAMMRRLAFREWMQDITDRAAQRAKKAARP
jgi:hypothetical protein